jgi:hypothetical protein
VELLLRPAADPSLLVPLAAFWAGESPFAASAFEAVLGQLGLLTRLAPELAPLLEQQAPSSLELDEAGLVQLVTQRSGGRINVKVYPGSQLVGGDQTRELVAMRQGVIDMAVFSTINISPQIREMNIFSLPFIFLISFKSLEASSSLSQSDFNLLNSGIWKFCTF